MNARLLPSSFPAFRGGADPDPERGRGARDEAAPSDADASEGAEAHGYEPPQKPEQESWYWLGAKVGLSMVLADLVARNAGFDSPTWSVLTAAFLATSPPIASAKAAGRKLVALAVGIALGAGGAYLAELLSGVPAIHFALVGIVAGILGSRSSDFLFAAVVGTVVTFVGAGGGDPLPEVVTTTACMVMIGCAIGPAVVWAVERVKRALWKRHRA